MACVEIFELYREIQGIKSSLLERCIHGYGQYILIMKKIREQIGNLSFFSYLSFLIEEM